MIYPLVQGFSLGLSLIIAIGAQNAFVLRQGLKKSYINLVWFLCSISDALLIFVGINGFGKLVSRYSNFIVIIRWGGAVFLIVYAIRSFLAALIPSAIEAGSGRKEESLRTVILTTLAFTWLNPHVYLDTLILLGSIGAQFVGINATLFGAGASFASLVWFFGLSHGASYLAPYLKNPSTWRILDLIIGITMLIIGLSLLRLNV